jgi:transcriptional regulator
MYIPKHFEESRIEVMHDLIKAHPLATLITLSETGLNANHIPLLLSTGSSPFGVLRGHVARSNSIWLDLVKDVEVLAVFHGPNAYITPSWYASKRENGKVVPTWNYAVVHAYGRLRVIDDTVWLRSQLEALTAHSEAAFSEPWSVSDAPFEFTEKLIESIVGIEINTTKLSGKWKVSQNQPERNQASVISGLRTRGNPEATSMAVLMEAEAKKAR